MIEEVHIIHHSHTDFGYTDLPSTIREQQVRYISEAISHNSRYLPKPLP